MGWSPRRIGRSWIRCGRSYWREAVPADNRAHRPDTAAMSGRGGEDRSPGGAGARGARFARRLPRPKMASGRKSPAARSALIAAVCAALILSPREVHGDDAAALAGIWVGQ